jgi:hypothetical protein
MNFYLNSSFSFSVFPFLFPFCTIIPLLYFFSSPQSLSLPTSVVDPNGGSGDFFTPGSGIKKSLIMDPGSATNIPDHISMSLIIIIWVKNAF